MSEPRTLDVGTTDVAAVAAPAGTVPVAAFSPSELTFVHDAERGTFVHQYDRDLQLVVVWSAAREHEAEVLAILRRELRVLAEIEVHWSRDEVVTNFERLYGQELWGTSPKPQQVGAGPFLLVVVEDPDPRYGYGRNVTGYVELTNLAVARAKRAARDLVGGYRIHSSNNIREFFHDATLVLGEERLRAVLAHTGDEPYREVVREDVVGSGGWRDLTELFGVLRLTSEYVVLRNAEDLPGALEDDREIDLLARDRTDLAAVAGARPLDPGGDGVQHGCLVGGEQVVLDVREVGDGYLDRRWQDDLLRRRTWHAGCVAVPRVDDHLFSLLYHAKVQKPAVKPVYEPRLRALSRAVGLPDDVAARITDDEVAAAVLDGFLSAHGYGLPRSDDPGVHRNDAFVQRFRLTTVEPTALVLARAELWEAARHSRAAELAARSTILRAAFRGGRSIVRSAVRRVTGRGAGDD
ncbi:hypothetical protein JN535_18635 [Cellulosimicrobium cellulans]|uniref:hypothetical protein n=1 Tax=Cellulosimicrobium cellulans TaxID=1710 RepID=UPI0019644A8F|nr:hypothetical protein [Cellulosimicrobium cellulans]MBN0042177.1 hypothetical protein [Cellulosimicrobium cellulans]